MDTQQQKPAIDPLRRVLVPIEKKTSKGTIVFRTTDNRVYARVEEGGPMFRAVPKERGKHARALDKKQRQEQRRIDARRAAMKAGDDPREPKGDAQRNNPEPPSNSDPRPAPGGAGTGTQDDPADVSEAQSGERDDDNDR